MFHELTADALEATIANGAGRQAYFFYTPLCGTCKLAQKMCTVAMAAVPDSVIYACNANVLPKRVYEWQITSVPCLVIAEYSDVIERMYAFPSVEAVYNRLKQLDT